MIRIDDGNNLSPASLASSCNHSWGYIRKLLVSVLAVFITLFLSSCGGAVEDESFSSSLLNKNVDAVQGVRNLDLSLYAKIPLETEQLTVSSVFQPSMDKDQLLQAGVEGYWHVMAPRTDKKAEWVSIALDESRPVALVRVLPRKGLGNLMWHGYTAALQTSRDGKEWKSIAALGIIPWPPPDDEWINFQLLLSDSYPYYRLYVTDVNFMSLARVELYQIKGYGAPLPSVNFITPSQEPVLPSAPRSVGTSYLDTSILNKINIAADSIQVSSVHLPGMGRDNLVRPGREGFWHVKSPREEMPAWLTVSLEESVSLAAINILPRAGFVSQLWNGDSALLEGSNDNSTWTPLAILALDKVALRDDWVGFPLAGLDTYRHFRISVYDKEFFSISRLELYVNP